MLIDGVEIGNLAVLAINRAMEVVGLTLTDAGIDERCVVGRINRKVKPHNAIASVGSMVNIYLLTGMVVIIAVELIAFARTDEFIENGLSGDRPIVQMQVQGLVAAILGLKMVLIYTRLTHHITIKVIGAFRTDGLIEVFGLIGMHHNRDADILCGIAIIEMACISGATYLRGGHRILRGRVVERIGWCPAVGIGTHASRSNSMEHRRFAFAKLGVVGIDRSRHRFYSNRALGCAQKHKFAERDVVEAKVIAATHGVLVQNGNCGRGGVAAVP